MRLTPQDFVSKWKRVTARETQTYQADFLDLCYLGGRHLTEEKLLFLNFERGK